MNLTISTVVISGLIILLWVPFAFAQTPACNQLSQDKHALATEILASQHPYACCDKTILECLGEKPVCPLAIRLAENICRRIADGQDKKKIVRVLSRRARTLLAIEFDKPKTFDLENSAEAGEDGAQVALVEFASARGPHCARMTPPTYQAVVNGLLKGKVKLYLKHFPLRKNPYSKEVALGFLAAGKQGKLWELLLLSYAQFDEFTLDKLDIWAKELGLNQAEFEKAVKQPQLKKKLGDDKLEGLENGVNSTPTFFINGHMYKGELTIEELVDVLEEVYEMKK
jgi:protein-disulfide isomerase